MLAEGVFRRQFVALDDVAERGQGGRSGSRAVPAPPCRQFGRQMQSGDEARSTGPAAAGDVERGAMVGRRADEWQTQRDVYSTLEVQRLQRNQRLIMIHADGRIIRSVVPED